MARPTVVFLHAHPDDEAIFTGGTMRLLAAAGARVVLVLATRGEQGAVRPGASVSGRLGDHRWSETLAAAELLGVDEVHDLGFADSGTEPGAEGDAFVAATVETAADRLAAVLDDERADAFVTYDPDGIYGHPDHVHAHDVGLAACAAVGLASVYDVTVDREYLHFVETHLVVEAGDASPPPGLGLAATSLGQPSVLITSTVDVGGVLEAKRAAMAAHASQIPETSSAMRLGDHDFAAVYGFEWYTRRGPHGPIETLPGR